jgi:hypothetical protein
MSVMASLSVCSLLPGEASITAATAVVRVVVMVMGRVIVIIRVIVIVPAWNSRTQGRCEMMTVEVCS